MPGPIESYGARPAEAARHSSFAEMLKGVAGEALSAGRTAEASSVAAIGGHGDLGQVVTAVSEAEMTLQTVVAVRERVIDAYKEILRMPM